MNATYILPIRLRDSAAAGELPGYLRSLPDVEIIIVDGSSPQTFAAVERLVAPLEVTHVLPIVAGTNGKARGVLTGLAMARTEKIVVADDDVRYDQESLRRVLRMLDDADVVRPQNYFSP